MKTIKQLLITIAVLLCSTTAKAYDFEVDGIYYNVLSAIDFTAEVMYVDSDVIQNSIVIPSSVTYNSRNLTVSKIGEEAFKYCSNVVEITIPHSVIEISGNAFFGCISLETLYLSDGETDLSMEGSFYDNVFRDSPLKSLYLGRNIVCYPSPFIYETLLESVTIGNSVTSMCSLEGCSGLTEIVIPDNVTYLPTVAFSECTGLTSITIPNSVTEVGALVFKNCTGLTNITISNNLTEIGQRMFSGCSNLTSITIPNSVTIVGGGAFEGCSSLRYLKIEDGDTDLSFEDAYSQSPFSESPLDELYLGRNISNFNDEIFECIETLRLITIGNKVTQIERLYKCSAINVITLEGVIPPIVYDDYFSDAQYVNVSLRVPHGSLEVYKTADGWKNFWNISEYYLDRYFYINYFVDKELYTVDSVKHGMGIIPQEEPEKEGYTFSGWSEIPETMPAHDVEVTGSFIPTNVSEINAEVSLQINGNNISLSNAINSTIAIYNINGVLVKRIDKYAGEEIILDKGVYIISVGNKAMKIIL